MTTQPGIHPTAIVHPSAKLAEGVKVGPWTLIEADVEIGEGTEVASHVVIKGPTVIGSHNRIYQFSTVGDDTPDLKYQGEPTRLVIGHHNVIREGVTIHRGTVQDRSETTIGDHNLLMAYVHIGHDSVVGNNTILVNNTALAGHVIVDDWAVLGGYTLVHQRCHIGMHAFTGMGTAVGKDIPAFVLAYGNPAEARGINVEGLKRRGFTREEMTILNRAYKTVYREGLTLEEALSELEVMHSHCRPLDCFIESLRSSTRGIVR